VEEVLPRADVHTRPHSAGGRQPDGEGGAAAGDAGCLDRAAVAGDDLAGECEAEAEAPVVVVPAREAVEETLGVRVLATRRLMSGVMSCAVAPARRSWSSN
jgi:hypothetical protein